MIITILLCMVSNVYFTKKFDIESISNLFKKLLLEQKIEDNKQIALKVHFGEKGNSRFVKPEQIKPIVELLKSISSNLFVTDTNTLYRGMRTNSTDHIQIAKDHGFGELNIPIIIADGELGADEVEISVNLKNFKTVKIGKKIVESDVIVYISHFKGHVLFGFGGAIKNASMGTGSRAGKLAMHSKIMPSVMTEKCTGCHICEKNCDVEGIIVDKIDEKAIINENCIGCAKCIAVCPQNAILIPWHGAVPNNAMERGAEYALGALKGKQNYFVTFINNISKDCDCMADTEIIGEDVGIVASLDPLAADKAAYDLTIKKNGKDIFKEKTRDGTSIFDYGQEIGLGEKEYNLVDID